MSAAFVAVLSTAGCGEEALLRPMIVEVQGVSSQAERLVVKLASDASRPSCGQMDASAAQSLENALELVWLRSSGDERRLSAPTIDSENVTVIAYTEDTNGTLIQLGCLEVDYLDIESPEIEIELRSIM